MPYWLYITLIVLGIYIVVSILLYYLQEYFLFRPEKLPADFQFLYDNQTVEEYNMTTRDGAVLNGLHFKVDKPIGLVLYLKGNSKSIKGWGRFYQT